ncbi:fatty acid desaturase [Cognatishimia maritima]|uniref:Omega-6 fatty acid desaturase (Delta-12 desaturase) n=1 Tax=Cognatishimia maritima TaxID=870908 RepID=A0A1M5JMN2_9RHOB|nr:fatty acid desaturase [Cognatishimia maritima]SHG41827.1 omega-6 fatty acid desaturase (delta-12 desaturase) [Cognatishimia maritima]
MDFQAIISKHRHIDNRTAWGQLLGTLFAYFAFLTAAVIGANHIWIVLPCAAACGLSAVRLYMLQHDCMHRCFLKPKKINDLIGVLLSPFTLTPFATGRYNHGLHHSHVGDLDHRDTFEINVLTVNEYREKSFGFRLAYRLYRHPFTLVLVGPFLVFMVFHRFPKNTLKGGFIKDVLIHNLMLLVYFAAVFGVAGLTGIWVLLLSIWIGVSLGAVIPYVEHNFEDAHWGRWPELTHEKAALENSAVLDFGKAFHWVTANIGFHDLHHLNPMIPNYNLKTCHQELENAGLLHSRKITPREALDCFNWKLWDEEQEKMVGFPA